MASLSLKVCNMPAKELAFTNKVYLNSGVLSGLNGIKFIETKNCLFTVEGRDDVATDSIAFNKVQREWAKIGVPADVVIKPFTPPSGAYELGSCNIEVDYYLKANESTPRLEIKEDELEAKFRETYTAQVFTTGQPFAMDFEGHLIKFTVLGLMPLDIGDGKPVTKVANGSLATHTELGFSSGTSGKVQVLSSKVQQRSIFRPDFNFEELGIGGLSKEFGDIFRRAFAARVFPPSVVRDLGIHQVRGMLLYGPPGTGKTLIARQLAKFLKAAEPKIVNGPEILNKFVGQSEENIRKLFADAEKEQKQLGENSQLHIVIFDEIDAICKSRGSAKDSTGVSDSIVNQLLSKIDGVDSLNNILIIGMTNRIDMIDEALLRPGRLEVHVEISLPSETGRVEIINIHTAKMREKGYLGPCVSVEAIAKETKNFSGAELEGLIRSATSFALNRKVDVQDISKAKDLTDIRILQSDFEHAMSEVKPAFGCHTDEFEQCVGHGIISYSPEFDRVQSTLHTLLDQVRTSENTPLLTVLLSGMQGCGKTALAAEVARKSGYMFVRRISNENYVGYSEHAKVTAITKIFDDAYKSDLSLIVLDDLERLMDYVRIGPRFSNLILQALFALLKKQPPKAHRRLLVIASTSDPSFLEEAELIRVFNAQLPMPVLKEAAHFKAVLSTRPGFSAPVVEAISQELAGRRIGVRTALLVAEMTVQRQPVPTKEAFMECLATAGSFE